MARILRMASLSAVGFGLVVFEVAARSSEPHSVADVNVRYHLLPGVKVNGRGQAPTPQPTVQAQTTPVPSPTARPTPQPTVQAQTTPVPSPTARPTPQPTVQARATPATPPPVPVPPPVTSARSNVSSPAATSLARNLSKTASWEPLCAEPVRVSFYGDYWVPPYGPAAALKMGLFENVQTLLNWGDFNVVNFEGNITAANNRAFPKFPYALKQAPESVDWLKLVGIRHLTRANNHSMDFGWTGAQDTTQAIEKAGSFHTGLGRDLTDALKPMWLEKNGLKIAVFSATTTYPMEAWANSKKSGVAHPYSSLLQKEIERARADADFVVVTFHWGDELKPAIKHHQREHAKMVLKAGADLVIGHHAHLAQVIDSEPKDGMVVYGVGNFIFASVSRDAKFGLGAHAEFCRATPTGSDDSTHQFRVVLTPIMTDNRVTGYKSRPMTLAEFLPFAREYTKKGYFSRNLEFHVFPEGRVQTLSDWLQESPQVSKNGQ